MLRFFEVKLTNKKERNEKEIKFESIFFVSMGVNIIPTEICCIRNSSVHYKISHNYSSKRSTARNPQFCNMNNKKKIIKPHPTKVKFIHISKSQVIQSIFRFRNKSKPLFTDCTLWTVLWCCEVIFYTLKKRFELHFLPKPLIQIYAYRCYCFHLASALKKKPFLGTFSN